MLLVVLRVLSRPLLTRPIHLASLSTYAPDSRSLSLETSRSHLPLYTSVNIIIIMLTVGNYDCPHTTLPQQDRSCERMDQSETKQVSREKEKSFLSHKAQKRC